MRAPDEKTRLLLLEVSRIDERVRQLNRELHAIEAREREIHKEMCQVAEERGRALAALERAIEQMVIAKAREVHRA